MSEVIDGESEPSDARGSKIVIKGNSMTIVLKRPDDKKEERHNKEMPIQGVDELEGDTLTICTANPPRSKDRPKEFTPKKGSEQVLMVLKREKK